MERGAGSAADPDGELLSLCAQVLVNAGAKGRKIHCDLSVLLLVVGNGWASHLALAGCASCVPSCACLLPVLHLPGSL